ncbi:hypothetical protein WJX72_000203 [[Myrmecia] bisecta]
MLVGAQGWAVLSFSPRIDTWLSDLEDGAQAHELSLCFIPLGCIVPKPELRTGWYTAVRLVLLSRPAARLPAFLRSRSSQFTATEEKGHAANEWPFSGLELED